MALASQFDTVQGRLADFRDEVTEISGDAGALAAELRELAKAEVRLALAETKEQVGIIARLSVAGGIVAVLASTAIVFVFLTMLLLLDIVMPLWAASLVTTATILVLVAVAAMYARSTATRISLAPKRTISSIKEDFRWAKSQLKSNER